MSYAALDVSRPVWDRFFSVSPLVLIGTRDADGAADLAPKHMVTPLGWGNYFGFVCTPRHATYRNAIRAVGFTVSYPRPDQLVQVSLSAEPRCEDGRKPSLPDLPTRDGEVVPAPLLEGAYAHLECELDRVVDGFGENALLVGKIVAAKVQSEALRALDREDGDVIAQSPLLAYLAPGAFASIERGHHFPFPKGFSR